MKGDTFAMLDDALMRESKSQETRSLSFIRRILQQEHQDEQDEGTNEDDGQEEEEEEQAAQKNAVNASGTKTKPTTAKFTVANVKELTTRGQVKTSKGHDKGDHRNHLVMNESEYGTYLGLRSVENAKPERNALCARRKSDNKFSCYPDVIYIGTSKSGTTSMAAHLAFHPMVQNILSEEISNKRRSKEGHFWEREKVGHRVNSSHLSNWINFT